MNADNKTTIVVAGSAPNGLRAAAHAAEPGISRDLPEAFPAPAIPTQHYQQGKSPGFLPLLPGSC